VPNHVDPGANIELVGLESLKHMFDMNTGDDRRTSSGVLVLVLEAQGRSLDDILVNTAAVSSVIDGDLDGSTSPRSGPWCLARNAPGR
jgi:hypothetical protein